MSLSHTELMQIGLFFGIKPVPAPVEVETQAKPELLPIRDGIVSREETVWWRYESGPEQVKARYHWANIRLYPKLYSHTKPQVLRVEYSA